MERVEMTQWCALCFLAHRADRIAITFVGGHAARWWGVCRVWVDDGRRADQKQHIMCSFSRAYLALNNGTIDILSGTAVERKHDFESSPSLGGFHFSTVYYYGNKAQTGE